MTEASTFLGWGEGVQSRYLETKLKPMSMDSSSILPPNTLEIVHDGTCITSISDDSFDLHTSQIVWKELDGLDQCRAEPESLLRPLERLTNLDRQLGKSEAMQIRRRNVGLVPIIRRIAEKMGRELRVFGANPLPIDRKLPPADQVRGSVPANPGMLDAIASNRQMIIKYDRSVVDNAELIGQIVAGFPEAQIAILANNEPELKRIKTVVSKYDAGIVLRHRDSPRDLTGRVIATSCFNSVDGIVALSTRDLVILPRALDSLTQRGQQALATMDGRFRLVGMMPIGDPVSPFERDWLVAAFGLHEFNVWEHGYGRVQVDYVFLPIRATAEPASDDLVAQQRRGYWRNDPRNQDVAQLAQAIANGEWSTAIEKNRNIQHWLSQNGEQPINHVLVVVETVPHCRAPAGVGRRREVPSRV